MKDDEIALRESLSILLQNADVLPCGGHLRFGLEFMYPVAAEGTKLENLINSLKGGDAMAKPVLEQLNLNPPLKVIYEAVIENADEIDDWEVTGERYRYTERAVQIMLNDPQIGKSTKTSL